MPPRLNNIKRTKSTTLLAYGSFLLTALSLLHLPAPAVATTPEAYPQFNVSAALWSNGPAEAEVEGFFSTSGHTNNWAVLVCTSRFWFNYRHIANTLSMYHTVKRLGIPDSNIILMLSDDVACNARNHFPATVYNNVGRFLDLYGKNIEVDYRGYEVTVENFIRLLTGRHDPSIPRSKRLLTDDRSNILVYMTGHGGEEFLKFQDAEEISSYDIADAFGQMHEKSRYHEIFFMIDTCQAASMYKQIYSPNIIAAASALTGQNSYSHHLDPEIGVAVIDRFTYYNLETLERLQNGAQDTLQELFQTYSVSAIASTPGIRTDLYPRGTQKALVTDFFGGVQNIELTKKGYTLTPRASSDIAPSRRKGKAVHHRKETAIATATASKTVRNSALPLQDAGRPSLVPFLAGAVVCAALVWAVQTVGITGERGKAYAGRHRKVR
ncbi:peptidase C13 family-domain-containing protein [Fimicolochytrium jonesii]|uniref:peptidase C13 family-domain-containing protein n=1 Tax=Fimicolochytrium jonesii TaxID=1396493 RepID=UPI0022FEC2F1|nr:peptidase C13 family-domain-containing protein [Fimicolochytrium jonesii]KAI8825245.1 peptidase C13 family-domain-containing protein [Fimicolochytrium jonesii]